MIHYQERGFTLIELVTVVSIVSILMVLAVPSMRNSILSSSISSKSSEIISTLNLARLEAVRRVSPTRIVNQSGTDGDWSKGYSLIQNIENNDTTLRVVEGFKQGIVATSSTNEIRFDPRGFANQQHQIIVCNTNDKSLQGRSITVEASGNIAVIDHDCGA